MEEIGKKALQDAVVSAATTLYLDDPLAVGVAVADVFMKLSQRVSPIFASTPTLLTPESSVHSEVAKEAVLAAVSGDHEKWEKEKSMLWKHAKTIPDFPGDRCRTDPDVWEDWWEKVYAIQTIMDCSSTMTAS